MGCELLPGREAFVISPSQVVSNLGGCHAVAFLLVGTPVGPLSSWLLIFLKPTEMFESSALLLNLFEFGQWVQSYQGGLKDKCIK